MGVEAHALFEVQAVGAGIEVFLVALVRGLLSGAEGLLVAVAGALGATGHASCGDDGRKSYFT